jgi:hypothetical protein
MMARLLAIGALAAVLAVNGIDLALLHIPAVRNGPIMYGGILVAVVLAFLAIYLARTLLTLAMLALVLLLGGGYVAGRTLITGLPHVEARLAPGDVAPDFALGDATLASLRGDGSLVIVFSRGAW